LLRLIVKITWEWWETRRSKFDLYTSQLVIGEASAGDSEMARMRIDFLDGVPLLNIIEQANDLARILVAKGPIPKKAAVDALHIAIAAVHGMDYLLTWNCKHIANAEMQVSIGKFCRISGYEPPVICTPEELLGS
jgi:hypothetical protein